VIHVDLGRMGPLSPRDPAAAIEAMRALEAGAVANPSEGRQVGHYWLRGGGPYADQVAAMHAAVARLPAARTVVWCGIGGSALGPQLLQSALGGEMVCLDNTDPAGIERALAKVDFSGALVMVVSKSGGTKETRNAFAECLARGATRVACITGEGSALERSRDDWEAVLPLWSWVGGRTSVTSAVGLATLKLLGHDTQGFLAGARAMDEATRGPGNVALRLASAWLDAAPRAMVVLPYCDGLQLFPRYLQQLVMESLGKDGQGMTVYGNKGSTDQHAYVQQLRDGPDDFFATFVAVTGGPRGIEVEPGVTTGDYLQGFLIGTRNALSAQGKRSLTITLDSLDAWHLGGLIALYERAVGYAATLMEINAYDQPGVEAGKQGAADALAVLSALRRGGEVSAPEDDIRLLKAWLAATESFPSGV